MSETMIEKLERGRAEYAYKCALNGKDCKDKNYKSYVKKLPMMILANGLGSTLAFVASKKKDRDKPENAYNLIYEQITDYFKSNSNIGIKLPENKDLCEWIISCDSQTYRYITNEVLAFLNWLRRFAEALIEEEENE